MLPKPGKMNGTLTTALPMEPAEPLWKRAPREDEHGRPLMDFMMVLPRLKHKSPRFIRETITKIEAVLARYADSVVFADFNVKLNVLCVIMKPAMANCWELAGAINDEVPEALLVAQPRFW